MKTRKCRTPSPNTNHSTTYKKEDYESSDGMLTTVWGPSLWHSLHTMSFNYPVKPTMEDKRHYMAFLKQLKYVLPCKYCRINLRTNFKQLPLTMAAMESRDTFSKYVYDLHELVNRMLHKESNLSYCDVRERYEHFRARCTEEKRKIFKLKSPLALKKTTKKHKGCTEPLFGKKSKCVIKIVPQESKCETFQMDKSCIKTRKIR
jgi:Erv1 / Alr family